jgi:hypothetical protein
MEVSESLSEFYYFIDHFGLPAFLIIIGVVCLFALLPLFRKWMAVSIEDKRAHSIHQGELTELTRNLAAIVSNNTEAINMFMQDRDLIAHILDKHVEMSTEQHARFEGRMDEVLQDGHKIITLLNVIQEQGRK